MDADAATEWWSALPGWVFILDASARYVWVNARFAGLLRVPQEQCTRQFEQDLCPLRVKGAMEDEASPGFSHLMPEVLQHQKTTLFHLDVQFREPSRLVLDQQVCLMVPLKDAVLFQLQPISDWNLTELETGQAAVLQHIADLSSSLIFAKDQEGRFTLANRALAETYGTTPEQMLGKTDLDFQMDLQQVEKYREADRLVIENRQRVVIEEETITDPQGNRRYLQTVKQFLHTPFHQNQVLGIATDITHLKVAHQSLQASEERYRSLYTEASVLLERSKADLKRVQALYQVSEAVQEATTLQELLNRICHIVIEAISARWCSIFKLNHLEQVVVAGAICSSGSDTLRMVSYGELMNGLTGWVIREQTPAFSPKNLPDPRESPEVQAGRMEQKVGSIIVVPLHYRDRNLAVGTLTALNHLDDPDFTQEDLELMRAIANQVSVSLEQRELMDRIEHMAFHDALTGLPNRVLFHDRLHQALAYARRKESKLAVLFMDLDGFKNVNDSCGHHIGDLLLKAAGERWSTRIRQSDTLARMSGDEFAVLLNDIHRREDVERVAEDLLGLVRQPFELLGHTVHVTASIGISIFPDDAQDQHTLLIHADHTMYRIKSSQKNDLYRQNGSCQN
ncbi:diguanylate cyclase domain-containing protein [Deinococcus cellulosilyticus]|nr:diguanylate cyclase [Deinococcus cellulosilyticus]